MVKAGGFKVTIIVALILVAVYFSLGPIQTQTNLGLDLQGGAHVVLEAQPEEGQEVTPEIMESVTAIIRERVDAFGVSEPLIQREGDRRVIVELAGIDNPEDAIAMLGKTARLEFRAPNGTVIVTGADLKEVSPQKDGRTNENVIALSFTPEGADAFGAATMQYTGQKINIYLDGELIQDPVVNSPILNGEAQISGGFATFEDAARMAALLRSGSLPVDLEIIAHQTVGPTLGQDSLNKSIKATAIGVCILFIFLIAYYRLPGVVAVISMVVYGLLLIWGLNLLNATLTLPGIAGFVLSAGMAVDANIIIYERIKEELRAGKSLFAGIESGFKRAVITIIDANVTTLIAALVLFQFGTGSVKGFAVTLSLGLFASMFTAIVFTKYLLLAMASINGLRNKKFYGA